MARQAAHVLAAAEMAGAHPDSMPAELLRRINRIRDLADMPERVGGDRTPSLWDIAAVVEQWERDTDARNNWPIRG